MTTKSRLALASSLAPLVIPVASAVARETDGTYELAMLPVSYVVFLLFTTLVVLPVHLLLRRMDKHSSPALIGISATAGAILWAAIVNAVNYDTYYSAYEFVPRHMMWTALYCGSTSLAFMMISGITKGFAIGVGSTLAVAATVALSTYDHYYIYNYDALEFECAKKTRAVLVASGERPTEWTPLMTSTLGSVGLHQFGRWRVGQRQVQVLCSIRSGEPVEKMGWEIGSPE